MDIEIRRGLAEARALASERWQPLLVYIGLGVLLPFALLASEPIFSLRNLMAIAADPWTYRVSGSITGPLYLLAIVSVIVTGAMLAAWNALLVEIREGFLSEIMFGMVAGLGFLFVTLIVNLAVGFGLAAIIWGAVGPRAWLEMPLDVQFLPRLVGWTLTSWLAARFCLAGPIMGALGKLEPVTAFAESWRRTRSAQGRLFALYLGLNIGAGIVVGLLVALHGYLILNGDPGSLPEMLMSGVWALLWSGWFAAAVLIPAGLYRVSQPGATAAEVFA
ncbi:MAG TPA: hypothetical protein PKD99_04710 [Sphingopyxis sp.]|nr:hypothetical protein [Sphingopyxis sp.]HMP44387.1 hypothetical protein [Sphingopyxis sp.]HMQ19010.1 hypothetical protein [Sphingopyxis sp.]